MKAVAIIPARGGSKRIPRKNIKLFFGKPIISYSIDAALKSGLFDEVMVSTDDQEISDIAIQYGACVPFMRSKETSDDFATTSEVLIEVIEQYKQCGKNFDFLACIYPTSPFVTSQKLNMCYDKLISENYHSVFPVVKFSYPILRSLKLQDGKLSMNWPEYINSRSQDLPDTFHDSGQFYFGKTHYFLEARSMFTENTGAIIIPETEVQDIDNETDWKLAELKFSLMNL